MNKLYLAVLLALLLSLGSAVFNLTDVTKSGLAFNKQTCNVQTIIDFKFNSSSSAAFSSSQFTSLTFSNFTFLDSSNTELFMTLNSVSYDTSAATTGFVTGYAAPAISAAVVFEFISGSNIVYVYIPFTTNTISNTHVDVVDLTSLRAPLNSLDGFAASGGSLSPFNFFDYTDYNQWYTQVTGTNTVLVSKFVYKVTATTAAVAGPVAPASALTGLTFDATTAAATGDKLCYASTSNGNFQTHFRQSYALWFIFIVVFIYWLLYLFSDTITKEVFNVQKQTDNIWTAWSLYSIFNVFHEQFFTKLSRLTVILTQWTIQGVFIASIIAGAYTTGPAVLIWSAVIALVITIPFPFIWGNVFMHKIYQKYLIKYHTQKKILEETNKEKVKEYEDRINSCDQKLFGYFHWYYCTAFIIFWICWPITIDRLATLPRTAYDYQRYWLAAMACVFVLEYFVLEPLMIVIFKSTSAIKKRGGYFYDIRLGTSFSEVNEI